MHKDVFEMLLDEVACELPAPFFDKLNGGIVVSDEAPLHPQSIDGDLYIMGTYHSGGEMGSYITIYYGSFMRTFGRLDDEAMKRELRSVLRHEFRHHLERLSGKRDLEIEDDEYIREYLENKREKSPRVSRRSEFLKNRRIKKNEK